MKDHLGGIIAGILMVGAGIALNRFKLDYTLFTIAGNPLTLAGVLGGLGIIIAVTGKYIQRMPGFLYMTFVVARTGKEAEKTEEALGAEHADKQAQPTQGVQLPPDPTVIKGPPTEGQK